MCGVGTAQCAVMEIAECVQNLDIIKVAIGMTLASYK